MNRAWSDSVMIPAFSVDQADGSHGQIHRQCTGAWKIRPIRQWLRGVLADRGLGTSPGVVQMQMGISLDEWQRMRTSDVRYIVNAYPLVERRLAVADCLEWLTVHGLPVAPRSSCTFCPYKSVRHWQELKRTGGPDWAEAVQVDESIRGRRPKHGPLYIHPMRRPLAEAVSIPEDIGAQQMDFDSLCDGGICGT